MTTYVVYTKLESLVKWFSQPPALPIEVQQRCAVSHKLYPEPGAALTTPLPF
jgi:hypothetical protein